MKILLLSLKALVVAIIRFFKNLFGLGPKSFRIQFANRNAVRQVRTIFASGNKNLKRGEDVNVKIRLKKPRRMVDLAGLVVEDNGGAFVQVAIAGEESVSLVDRKFIKRLQLIKPEGKVSTGKTALAYG